MKIILVSVGTRGDMEPFLATGELLNEKGHEVICAFPEQFRGLAEDSDLAFASLGAKYIDLLDSKTGRDAMGGSSGIRKFIAILKLARNQNESQKELADRQYKLIEGSKPDRVVFNSKAIYPVIWGAANKGKALLISSLPYLHYVKGHSHIAFNSNLGVFLNKFTYSLYYFGIVTTARITLRWLMLGKKPGRKQIKRFLLENQVLYAISPSLFSRPEYWNENLKVIGYHERGKTIHWQPDTALTAFLSRHDKILMVTFGSMINPEPDNKTALILDILVRNKIPAIINTASGGLTQPVDYDSELIHFVSGIPYDWIFPKLYAVIHHGGSGTTHLALKYGCASMIVPHIIDQFVWNNIIHDLGAGPKGIKMGKLTTKNLEPKILELMGNASFKKKAEHLAVQMENEKFSATLCNEIIKDQ